MCCLDVSLPRWADFKFGANHDLLKYSNRMRYQDLILAILVVPRLICEGSEFTRTDNQGLKGIHVKESVTFLIGNANQHPWTDKLTKTEKTCFMTGAERCRIFEYHLSLTCPFHVKQIKPTALQNSAYELRLPAFPYEHAHHRPRNPQTPKPLWHAKTCANSIHSFIHSCKIIKSPIYHSS